MSAQPRLLWDQLPPIPDREGFASPFAGSSGGALIVAGGANFADKRPWEGGTKKWYDQIFVLNSPDGAWQNTFRLPRPTAYGVSLTVPEGILCVGGGDATEHFREVFLLKWDGTRIEITPLPMLPQACAFMSGATANGMVYITGGIETPSAAQCLDTFWALDRNKPKATWQELPTPPGSPARMLSVTAATGDSFYRFSGAGLFAGPDGKPKREYLRDVWRFTPKGGWTRLHDLPRACVAGASPAPRLPTGHIIIISGDDGTHVDFKPETQHPGFPRQAMLYNPELDRFESTMEIPFSRATVPTTSWHDRIIIPSGEARPGYRSNEVWSMRVEAHP